MEVQVEGRSNEYLRGWQPHSRTSCETLPDRCVSCRRSGLFDGSSVGALHEELTPRHTSRLTLVAYERWIELHHLLTITSRVTVCSSHLLSLLKTSTIPSTGAKADIRSLPPSVRFGLYDGEVRPSCLTACRIMFLLRCHV